MRFFIDETSDPELAQHLAHIWRDHRFRTYLQEQLSGTLDTALFPELAHRGFDVFITEDRQQLIPASDEYAALCASGLHWVGHPQLQVAGRAGFALRTASVMAGFPFVLDEISRASTRMAVHIKGVYRENRQRVKCHPLVSQSRPGR